VPDLVCQDGQLVCVGELAASVTVPGVVEMVTVVVPVERFE